MARLLVVHHSPTARMQKIASALLRGTALEEIENVEVVTKQALEATSSDVIEADGYLLGTTANFGYISGAMKHFFDTTFYDTNEITNGRPFSYWIHGSHDTTGAENAMRSITTGYGWKLACKPLVFKGDLSTLHLAAAEELGATLAATIMPQN